MIHRKKLLIAFVVVLMTLLAPMSALAGTRVTGGYTLTFPDDMLTCKPLFAFTLAGASSTATVEFTLFDVNMTTSAFSAIGGGSLVYDAGSGLFTGSFATMVGEGVHTFFAGFTVRDPDAGVPLKQVSTSKWEVTCEAPPPPTGGEGCTPGYWKQPQHLDSWMGYAPSDLYNEVFGVNFKSGLTLLQALGMNGGGANALARHSTAALLDARSTNVDYDFSVAQVIQAVQSAFATRNFEGVKNVFEFYNEQGCPLN